MKTIIGYLNAFKLTQLDIDSPIKWLPTCSMSHFLFWQRWLELFPSVRIGEKQAKPCKPLKATFQSVAQHDGDYRCRCEDLYSLEINHASSKIIPALEKGNPQITVKIAVKSNLGEAGCTDDLSTPDIWDTMENKQAQAVRQEIMLALNRARQLNTDIFGFGDALYKEYPAEWKQFGANWQYIFPMLKGNIVVASQVGRPGLTVKTFITDKGDK